MKYRPLMTMTRPGPDVFMEQVNLVAGYSDLRMDRASEILSQLNGGLAFLGAVGNIQPDRMPHTVELLGLALQLVVFIHLRLKHAFACRRPAEYSAQIQPIIVTPSHGSLPSGHATEAFAAAVVLWHLLKDAKSTPYGGVEWRVQLLRLAARIAINRTVAGVHFPVDSVAGMVLGVTLGHYLVQRFTKQSGYLSWEFDGTQFGPTTDFHWHTLINPTNEALTPSAFSIAGSQQSIKPTTSTDILPWFWDQAKTEWA